MSQDSDVVDLDATHFDDPRVLLAKLGTTRPIHRVTLPDGMPAWLVTGYSEGRKALADPRLVRKGSAAAPKLRPYLEGIYNDGFFPHSMVFNDRPDHTRMKQVVSQAFTPRRMETLRPQVQKITDELFDAIAGLGHADVLESLALPLPNAVICDWFDIPREDRKEFVKHCGVITGLTVSVGDSDLADASQWFDEYLTRILAERRAEPGDDMISAMLLSQRENDNLSDLELRSNIFLMLIGSVETAVNMISNGTLALLRNPESIELLRADPTLLGGAIEEILRIDAPVMTVMYHFATDHLTIGDVQIQPGEHVAVSLTAANYDAGQFPDPELFDIRRKSGPHLSFSHGVHFCLGAPLARLEGEVFFETLLRRLPDLALAVADKDLVWKPSFLVHRLSVLPVTFTATAPV
ncbi:cytochrome P450 [Winogradskya consettensis]|uniref:Cytochrome P450 n=1 Tax=Winogradskya consettensis TaxID=113560 RepID=A0A919SC17_9ACTN|nr:cytochrome P450 [Actinoplanes consettensis]GIM67758.1 cytochrome P450 [Actinoplanes consettensis]